MRETVGLRSYGVLYEPQLLKRDALMFRKIGVICCERLIDIADRSLPELAPELRWLVEQGIVFDAPVDSFFEDSSLDNETREVLNDSEMLLAFYKGKVAQDSFVEEIRTHLELECSLRGLSLENVEEILKRTESLRGLTNSLIFGELLLRPLSSYYRNNNNMDVCSIFYATFPELVQQTADVGDVIDITINQLPIPDGSTPWEQIIDFRNDPDTQIKFRRFQVWMNKIVRANLAPREVEQELAVLLDEYRQHMELHFKKTNTSTLETILVAIGDRKFGDIVKIRYSLRDL
jgi:hypothetical protein